MVLREIIAVLSYKYLIQQFIWLFLGRLPAQQLIPYYLMHTDFMLANNVPMS